MTDVSDPQQLIHESHRLCAEERSRVQAAHLLDEIDETAVQMQYHAALMEYFSRLEPHLPDRREYWEDVPLFSEPVDGRREQLAEEIAEYTGCSISDAHDALDELRNDPDEWDEMVCGLKALRGWRTRSRTVEIEEHSIVDGRQVKTVERPQHLPVDVAMHVHDLLDEAAAELGYNTRPGKDIAQSHLDAETGRYEVTGLKTDPE